MHVSKRHINKVLGAAATVAAATSSVLFATASPAQASESYQAFYCAGAASVTWCDNVGIVGSWYIDYWADSITIQIDNPAAGGERCQLRMVYPDKPTKWGPWINLRADQGNNVGTLATNVPLATKVDLRCVRRGSGGDAGIGGYMIAHQR
jgi:hypothetical protein